MQIHIGRNGQPLGTFSEEQVRDGIALGNLLGTDLAWHEGMDDWKPLSSFPIFMTPPALPSHPISTPVVMPATTPVASTSSGLATASMICGIASIPGLLCCVSLPLALAAIICGHLALSEIAKNPRLENSRGMAKAGLIMGYIIIALSLMMVIFQVGMAGVSAFMDGTRK
ncbi:MAG: hypothetical protein RL693_177 [Verrucomicrobiota bacterium]|jgi:hypothetical protein